MCPDGRGAPQELGPLLGRASRAGPSLPPPADASVFPALMLIHVVSLPLEKGLFSQLELLTESFQAAHRVLLPTTFSGMRCCGLENPALLDRALFPGKKLPGPGKRGVKEPLPAQYIYVCLCVCVQQRHPGRPHWYWDGDGDAGGGFPSQ